MHTPKRRPLTNLLLTALLISTTPALAQNKQQDNSGTNPVNFTWDWRSYLELQHLPHGDNSSIVHTIEQRVPLGKYQFRYRVRQRWLSFDPDGNGTSTEINGIGDFDVRFLAVPLVDQRYALATGLEITFDTASNVRLGAGKHTLGPQIFAVLFKPPGGGQLVAPAYQFVFDVAGDDDRPDVRRSQFDLFYLWLAQSKKWWMMANPQAVIDHENDVEFALFEAEYGRMMFAGLSSYLRPSIGLGDERPYDWSAEGGFKVIYK
jgi:hypothetical protein